ncbi:MAG: pyrroloquinoline-quinone synthase PqqC [Gammaproteobacteria bacterium]|nr:pyrroloquinoline-quinone synthase PqqC [Gammaproteobacteria bacterium]
MSIKLKNQLSAQQLEQHLRDIGERYYHDKHPFHRLLHTGELNLGQVQAWALNRYCYQAIIPVKDARLMARMPCHVMRREWRQRIADHDGSEDGNGGIERWLKLTDGLGLTRDYVISQDGALPASKFAADAYVRFVSEQPLLDAVASSLTEIFSPTIIAERVSGMLKNYDFITEETLAYFKPRLTQARRDVDFALHYVLEYACTISEQEGVLNALRFKCDILWSQLDALYFSYVEPRFVSPDCFIPDER